MPNRIIKESICTSDNIDTLSAFQETVFYRLLVNCDDYGRMDARPKILASKLFPLKDIRTNAMEDALRALTSAELVILYEVGGKPFLQMKTWDRHQQIRAKKSKYPAPGDGILAQDITCNQMISDDSKCPRNPIQSESKYESESESESESNAIVRTPAEEAFDVFWAAYPKKVGKKDAMRAFLKVPAADRPLLVPAIERQKQSRQWQEDGGRFIPNPSTWLNQGRWMDEGLDESIRMRPRNKTAQDLEDFYDMMGKWVTEQEAANNDTN